MKPIALAVAIAAASCTSTEVNPVRPTPQVGAGYKQACDRGRKLGCAYAKDTPDGAMCEDVLANLEVQGFDVNTECMAGADTCDAVDLCSPGVEP